MFELMRQQPIHPTVRACRLAIAIFFLLLVALASTSPRLAYCPAIACIGLSASTWRGARRRAARRGLRVDAGDALRGAVRPAGVRGQRPGVAPGAVRRAGRDHVVTRRVAGTRRRCVRLPLADRLRQEGSAAPSTQRHPQGPADQRRGKHVAASAAQHDPRQRHHRGERSRIQASCGSTPGHDGEGDRVQRMADGKLNSSSGAIQARSGRRGEGPRAPRPALEALYSRRAIAAVAPCGRRRAGRRRRQAAPWPPSAHTRPRHRRGGWWWRTRAARRCARTSRWCAGRGSGRRGGAQASAAWTSAWLLLWAMPWRIASKSAATCAGRSGCTARRALPPMSRRDVSSSERRQAASMKAASSCSAMAAHAGVLQCSRRRRSGRTVATPLAMASMVTLPKVSDRLGNRNRSALAKWRARASPRCRPQ